MANPLKLSIGVSIDPSAAKSGGASAQAAVAAIGSEAERSATKLQALINASAGLRTGFSNDNIREWNGALAMQGKSIDDLRAKYNPLFAVIRQYKETAIEIRTLHAQQVLSTDEMTAALSRHRQATLASIDAIKGRNSALRQDTANDNRGSGAQVFQTANIAAQFQDIGVTAAMGMSPIQIALQQGTQLSAVLSSMERPAAGLLSAFTSILNPVSLITIGVVGLSAATIQYFTSSESSAKKLEDALDEQAEAIKRVRDVWGEAAAARSKYGRESSGSATFGLETNLSELLKRLTEANTPTTFGPGAIATAITEAIDKNRELTGLTAREFRGTTLFKVLSTDLQELQKATVSGRTDAVLQVIASLEEIGRSSQNAGLKAIAQEAVAALQPFKDLATAIRDSQIELRRLFDTVGPNGMLLSQGTVSRNDMGDLAAYESRQRVQLERNRRSFEAELAAMNARSPEEKAAAARQAAAAEYPEDESAPARRQRIELAGKHALAEAEKALADAQRDRLRSLDETIASQRLDLSLIGQTVAETERLQMEQRLTAELKAEAARNGTKVDQAELAIIREKAAEYGRLRAMQAARESILSGDQELERRRAELALMGQSAAVREREVQRLLAEQEIRRLGIDLYGVEAEKIRENAAALSTLSEAMTKAQLQQDLLFERQQIFRSDDERDVAARLHSLGLDNDPEMARMIRANQQLERMRETWESIFDTARDGVDTLVDGLFDGGKDIGEVLKGIGRDFARLMFDLAITNPLKNWLTGSDLNSIADLGIFGKGASSGRGGFGGVLGGLLGAPRAVASMQVQAASVVINGAPIGGAGLLSAGFNQNTSLSRFLGGGANDNSVLRLPLNDIGAAASPTSAGGVSGQIWNFFAAKGLPPHQIAGILGHAKAESAFNPLAVGDSGNAFGLFQWNDRRGSLFNSIGGRDNLGDVQKQLEFAWKELTSTESRSLQALLSAKDVRGATAAFAGFERPSGFSWANPEGSHNFAGRLAGAEEALARFGGTASQASGSLGALGNGVDTAASGLNSLGSGFDRLGQNLATAAIGAGGGLGSLFASLGSYGRSVFASSGQFASAVASGVPGLWADGGFTGWGGKYEPAGIVHRGEVVWSQDDVRRNGGVFAVEAMRRGTFGGYGRAGFVSSSPAQLVGPAWRDRQAANANGVSRGDLMDAFRMIKDSLQVNVRNINVPDASMLSDYFATDEGERVLVNVMRRNQMGGRGL
ncbi:phage tail tip lysozyme [Sinorhizobium fredii]